MDSFGRSYYLRLKNQLDLMTTSYKPQIQNTTISTAADPNAVTNANLANDNALARFDGSGKIIQNSIATLSDTGDMSGLNTITSTTVKSINYVNNTNTFSLALPPLNDGYIVLDGSKYDATQNGI